MQIRRIVECVPNKNENEPHRNLSSIYDSYFISSCTSTSIEPSSLDDCWSTKFLHSVSFTNLAPFTIRMNNSAFLLS